MFANTTPTPPAIITSIPMRAAKGTSMAGLWLAFYGLIIGVAVLGKAGASSAIEVACNYLK